MGTLMSSKIREDGKVVYEVVVDSSESLQLKGHMTDVHIFSLNNMEVHSRLSKRGTNDATTYFLVPKEFREGLKESANAKCQLIRIPNKKIFVFTVDDF
jgi:hypothetical protein